MNCPFKVQLFHLILLSGSGSCANVGANVDLISPKNTLLREEASQLKKKEEKKKKKKNHSESALIQEAHLLEMLFVLLGAFCTLSFDQLVHLLLSAGNETGEGCRNVPMCSSFGTNHYV